MMVLGLLVVLSQSGWRKIKLEDEGWRGPSNTAIRLTPTDIPKDRSWYREELQQYLRINPDAKAFAGDDVELCVRKLPEGTIAFGYLGKNWLSFSTKSPNWQTSLKGLPNTELANRFESLKPFNETKAKCSTLKTLTGRTINLPQEWCWFDEKDGMDRPTKGVYALTTTKDQYSIMINQFRPADKVGPLHQIDFMGFSPKLIKTGAESLPKNLGEGLFLRLNGENVLLELENSSPERRRFLHRLRDLLVKEIGK